MASRCRHFRIIFIHTFLQLASINEALSPGISSKIKLLAVLLLHRRLEENVSNSSNSCPNRTNNEDVRMFAAEA